MSSTPQCLLENMELTVHFLVVLPHFSDSLDCVHHGGVIASTEGLANFGEAFLGEFL